MLRGHSKRQRQGGEMLRAVLALLLSVNGAAWPQAYPARAVKIVVPYGVGGPADLYARFIGAKLQDALASPSSSRTGPAAARSSAPTWWPSRRQTATRCS